MIRTKKCPVCGKKDFEQIEKVVSAGKEFLLARCIACGLAFQYPIPNKRDLREYYENLYGGKYDLKSTEEAFLNFDEKQEEDRIRQVERFKKKGKILDVGPSSGFFLKKIKEHKNWIGSGIEYSRSAAKSAINEGLNIKIGEITTVNFPDNYFDVITMHSVLEHIPDLTPTVSAVRKKLKRGGLFVFNVPNVSSFEFALYKFLKKPFAGFIFEHIYYFTPESIRILLKNNKFEILFMTSRHYSRLAFPPKRPLIGIATFIPKLFLEYTDLGGMFLLGNIIYAYAKKID